ncbi:MAG: mechanosensitive ion channel family protein [Wolinella sp.]
MNELNKTLVNWGEMSINALISYSPKVLLALLVLVLGYYFGKIARQYAFKLLLKITSDETLSRFLARILYAAIIVLTIITALANLGVQTASIIAVLGTAGLAIALSLKDSLSNLASGIMLIVFRHFAKGDSVEIDGIVGIVDEISLFHTRLTTPDHRSVVIPNSSIATERIINFSFHGTRRLEWIFGVSYDADITRVKEVILETLAQETRLLKEPAPFIGVHALGASSVDFIVRAWVKKEDFFATQFAINEAVKIALDRAGIEIPYNKLDVNLHTKSATL